MAFSFDQRARTISAEEQARRDAIQAEMKLESDLAEPKTGFGISISETALRMGMSVEQISQMIAEGKFETARLDVDGTGENEQYWVSPIEVKKMSTVKFVPVDESYWN